MNAALKPMVLETRAMPTELEQRNTLVAEMEQLLSTVKTEKRQLTSKENERFNSLKNQVEKLDETLQLKDGNKDEFRRFKQAGGHSPLEVRAYKKGENLGNGSNVTIGDLIYSHVTGRFRNDEVRQALSTTSGGLSIPTEVYSDFIDMLRNQSFLGETTVYPMNTQTLLIPRVTGDPVPAFKIENELGIDSEPLFASVTLQAKPLYCYTSISLELLEASNLNVGEVVSRIMVGAMQNAMQNFLLFGAPNGYSGILTDTGITTVTATGAVGYAEIGAGVQAILGNNGVPNALVMSADTMMGLELTTDTTGQFVTPPTFYQNLNKFALNGTNLGGDVIAADLSAIAWGILSEGGLQIEIDKSGEAFQKGQIKIRSRINGDFKVTNPKLVAHVDAP